MDVRIKVEVDHAPGRIPGEHDRPEIGHPAHCVDDHVRIPRQIDDGRRRILGEAVRSEIGSDEPCHRTGSDDVHDSLDSGERVPHRRRQQAERAQASVVGRGSVRNDQRFDVRLALLGQLVSVDVGHRAGSEWAREDHGPVGDDDPHRCSRRPIASTIPSRTSPVPIEPRTSDRIAA